MGCSQGGRLTLSIPFGNVALGEGTVGYNLPKPLKNTGHLAQSSKGKTTWHQQGHILRQHLFKWYLQDLAAIVGEHEWTTVGILVSLQVVAVVARAGKGPREAFDGRLRVGTSLEGELLALNILEFSRA